MRNPLHALVYSHLSNRLAADVLDILAEFLQNDAEVFFVSATTHRLFSLAMHGELFRFRCFVVPTTSLPMAAAVANAFFFGDNLTDPGSAHRFLQDLLEIVRGFHSTATVQMVQNSVVLNLH